MTRRIILALALVASFAYWFGYETAQYENAQPCTNWQTTDAGEPFCIVKPAAESAP